MSGRNSGLRTVDVARRAGCSVQQVRDLEGEGVLPPADRTPAGYRRYDESHVRAALAYRSLAAGVGPTRARGLMRIALTGPLPELLALLDAAHAELDRERRDLADAERAAAAIAHEPIADARPSDTMSVTELAHALGVRSSTLRHWEAEGLLTPGRAASRARRYHPRDVRDARIVHQLRLAGYRVPQLRTLMARVRRVGIEGVGAGLTLRARTIEDRSRALREAAAELVALLAARRAG